MDEPPVLLVVRDWQIVPHEPCVTISHLGQPVQVGWRVPMFFLAFVTMFVHFRVHSALRYAQHRFAVDGHVVLGLPRHELLLYDLINNDHFNDMLYQTTGTRLTRAELCAKTMHYFQEMSRHWQNPMWYYAYDGLAAMDTLGEVICEATCCEVAPPSPPPAPCDTLTDSQWMATSFWFFYHLRHELQ